jgi:hypothetical protein
MAQLDRFLAAMSEYKAEALVLEQDRPPAFRFVSGTKPVSRQVLDTDRILTLISELTGEQFVPDIPGGRREFEYGSEGMCYAGTIENEGGGIVAIIHQVVENAGEPPTGGVPQPPAGSYRAESRIVSPVQMSPPTPEPVETVVNGNGAPHDKRVGHMPTVGDQGDVLSGSDDIGGTGGQWRYELGERSLTRI